VVLDDFAEVTLIENFISENDSSQGGLSNLTHFKIGKGAKLNRILIQNMADGSSFHNLENFDLHANSTVVNVECFLGANQSRIETKGNLLQSGANFENFSFVSGRKEQLFDQRTEQHHLAPHCSSNLLSKNVLQEEAKSIFAGLIKVDPEAQETNALQTNRNLLLSKEAEADSLPGLEILANDVRCTHGATTSRLDQEELFYLLSRGIDKKSAESLISLGFIEEIVGKVQDEDLTQTIRDMVCNHFK
jgi:Fe-S cluster assembly protein SufD